MRFVDIENSKNLPMEKYRGQQKLSWLKILLSIYGGQSTIEPVRKKNQQQGLRNLAAQSLVLAVHVQSLVLAVQSLTFTLQTLAMSFAAIRTLITSWSKCKGACLQCLNIKLQ